MEIIHPDVSNYSEQEILEYIKKVYPPGTVHKGLGNCGKYTVSNNKIYRKGDYYYSGEDCGCIYSIKENYFAIIISYPSNYTPLPKNYELWR